MIRLALPTGDLRSDTASLLDAAGAAIADYAAGSRALRYDMLDGAGVARVFREKDIPVQVALGNYDAGICSLAWVEELTRRFPHHDVVRVCPMGFGEHGLWLAAAGDTREPVVRIASEYGTIADAVARRWRLRRYRVFEVKGAAEAYPPEDADIVLIAAGSADDVVSHGLRPLGCVFEGGAWLIANARSIATKDLSPLLSKLLRTARGKTGTPPLTIPPAPAMREVSPVPRHRLRAALPDGHAQRPTLEALESAGFGIDGYDGVARRPRAHLDGIDVKVIRPQDMPQQVALGQFDLAVTGRDVLFEHTLQFPSSPVEEIIDLGRSRYGHAAIVKDVAADTVAGAVRQWRAAGKAVIRVASEFPNIADHFARERHLGRYSVIPIAGASEGFVPEDAEILIEGIDTGSSVRANKLTVLERFFESTNIVIANKRRPQGELGRLFDAVVQQLASGALQPVGAGGA